MIKVKNDEFVSIPRALTDDTSLRGTPTLVYTALSMLIKNGDNSPSVRKITRQSGFKAQSIVNVALNKLINAGWVSRDSETGKYTIYDEAQLQEATSYHWTKQGTLEQDKRQGLVKRFGRWVQVDNQ